jgi:5-methylcytosine-specific restriction endonuclease McrA
VSGVEFHFQNRVYNHVMMKNTTFIPVNDRMNDRKFHRHEGSGKIRSESQPRLREFHAHDRTDASSVKASSIKTTLSNDEIVSRLDRLVPQERALTSEILELIREADRRRLYLELGYANIYKWLIGAYGYSQSAANRRIQAARLLSAVPEVREKILSGALNLTTLTQVQSTVRKEEIRTGEKVPLALKKDLLERIENKSSDEVQRLLAKEFPETQAAESLRFVSETESKLNVILDGQTRQLLERAKELMSHSHPGASWAGVIGHLAQEFVKRKDPLAKPIATTKRSSFAGGATDAVQPGEANRPTDSIQDQMSQLQKMSQSQKAQQQQQLVQDQLAPQLQPVSQPVSQKMSRAITRRDAAAARRGGIAVWLRRLVIRRAMGACEFVDRQTGRRCENRYQLEVDHIRPVALGGGNDLGNLRCLCRQHNLLMAEQVFGRDQMMRYRRR